MAGRAGYDCALIGPSGVDPGRYFFFFTGGIKVGRVLEGGDRYFFCFFLFGCFTEYLFLSFHGVFLRVIF